RAARWVIRARVAKQEAANREKQQEEDNIALAQAQGSMMGCACCYDEFPINRMVHCNEKQWFCIGCARQNAETVVGMSRYELKCMSMDGCSAGFCAGQRALFIDPKLAAALERIEDEAVLRMAAITNLETCPSCPYAAEYPPVEENKEFRCQNPDCLLVSCRLCRQDTHIPKTCQEAAHDSGISARRQIEEAMSAALIRKCNKCQTPFVKIEGCNRMTCPQPGCHNVQCYVCSQSCAYNHFDDERRGGRAGNCPLFDSLEERHQAEVRRAEEEARRKVMAENPAVDPRLLQFRMSKKAVKVDRRRQNELDRRRQNELDRRRHEEALAAALHASGLC
ncbi:hypothetical protein SODALDRAFT_268324, partial [Sodiomyces alkalinus F11]